MERRFRLFVNLLSIHLVVLFFTNRTVGSNIQLTSSSSSITPSLTPTLTLRCSINNTDSSNNSSFTFTGHTDYQVDKFIVISLQGHDIASISESSAARLLVNVSNIKVSGDLSIQAGDDRYLELTWTYPEASQAGDFHCEANAVNDLGHNVVFSTSLSVPAKQPTLADLAKILHDIKVDKSETQHTIDQLKHVETGVIQCGHSSRWRGHGLDPSHLYHTLYRDVTHRFQKVYETVPQVKVDVEDVFTYGNSDTRLGSSVVSVTKTGFTVRCSTWTPGGTENGGIHSMTLSWISEPTF